MLGSCCRSNTGCLYVLGCLDPDSENSTGSASADFASVDAVGVDHVAGVGDSSVVAWSKS